MILSESEAFWVAILYEELVADGSLLTPTCTSDATRDDEKEVTERYCGERVKASDPESPARSRGLKVYEQISDLAIGFGVARKPNLCVVCDGKPVEPPADIVWRTWIGHVLSPAEFEKVQTAVKERASITQEKIEGHSNEAEYFESFIRSMRDIQACLVAGYAPSTPGTLYHLSVEGEACVFGRVAPRDRGLYLSLLQLFRDTLPLPPLERLAMAAAGYPDPRLSEDWKLSLRVLENPLGSFDPEGFSETLRGFKESNESRNGWTTAWYLTNLISDARRFSHELDVAAQMTAAEDEYLSPELPNMRDEFDSNSDGVAPGEGEEESTQFEESVVSFTLSVQTPADFVTSFSSCCSDQIESALDSSEEVDSEEHELRRSSDNMLEYDLNKRLSGFRALADEAAQQCRRCGLTSVAEMIVEARRAAPLIRSNNPLESWLNTFSPELLGRLSVGFEDACALLADARKVAYGELRLRELKWDEHCLSGAAITGWSRQSENIRSAIKVAIEQLNNGLPPYVVLTQLAPAAEALVRQLAAKHLNNFQGMNPGKLLHELRQTIGLGPDDHKDRTTLSVAQALVSLRNWVVHEPDGQRGRDHAVFFLNGLSLLLADL